MITLFFILLGLALLNFLIQGVLSPLIRERILFALEACKDEILKIGQNENIVSKDIDFAVNLIDEGISLLPELMITKLLRSVPKNNIENPIEKKLHPSFKGVIDDAIHKTLVVAFVNQLFLFILVSPITVLFIFYFLFKNTFKSIKDNIIFSIATAQQSNADLELSLS